MCQEDFLFCFFYFLGYISITISIIIGFFIITNKHHQTDSKEDI